MIEKPKAICAKCKHKLFGKLTNGKIWYDRRCKMVENKRVIDPETGKKCFVEYNDLGGKCYTDDRYTYCRKVNTDGNCMFFEEKECWYKKVFFIDKIIDDEEDSS